MKRLSIGIVVALLLLDAGTPAQAGPAEFTVRLADEVVIRVAQRGWYVNPQRGKPYARRRGALYVSVLSGEPQPVRYPSYRQEGGRWVQKEAKQATTHHATASIAIRTIDPRRPPKGLTAPKQASKVTKMTTKSLGSKPPATRATHEIKKMTKVTEARRGSAAVTRQLTTRSGPVKRITAYAGGALTEPTAFGGVEEARIHVRFPYVYERFGAEASVTLQVELHIRNAPNGWAVDRTIDPQALETLVLDAVQAAAAPATAPTPARPAPTPDGPEPQSEPAPPSQPTTRPPVEPDAPADRPETSPYTGGPYGDLVSLLVRLGEVERTLLDLRAGLRAGVDALRIERGHLKDARRTHELIGPDSEHAPFYRKWIRDIEARIGELETEQREQLVAADRAWMELEAELRTRTEELQGVEALARDLRDLESLIGLRRRTSRLEVLLAAARHSELARLLPTAVGVPELTERAREIQALSYLDQGKMAETLYALRLGLSKHPDNETLARLERGVEVSFLKAIAAKADNDGLRIRDAWDRTMAGVEHGPLWAFLTGGLKRPWQAVSGKLHKLEALHGSAVELAAVQHHGVELLWRLRRQGLTFDEIERIDHEGLRKAVVSMAPARGAPDYESVENLLVSLAAAFEMPDVKRLRTNDRSLMRVSKDAYYGDEEFEASWGEYALSAISAKNVAMIFLPHAKIGGAGLLTRFARSAAGLSSRGLKDPATALSVRQWVYARPTMQRVAQSIADSKAGAVLRETRHALRAIRYDGGIVQRGTAAVTGFVAEQAGEYLVQQGFGYVGAQVGGEYGRLAGELMGSVVGVPGSGTVAGLQQDTARMREALEEARVPWEANRRLLASVRRPTREAADALQAGRTLTAGQRSALQEAIEQADEVAGVARDAARAPNGSALLDDVADEADTLGASARASLAGRAEVAVATRRAADVIDAEAREVAEAMATAERRLTQVASETPASPRAPPALSSRARAPGAPSPLDTPAPRPAGATVRLDDAPARPGGAGRAPAPAGGPRAAASATEQGAGLAELLRRAEQAMVDGRFEDAVHVLGTASRLPAVARSPSGLGQGVLEALAEARGAARAARVFRQRARLPRVQQLAVETDEAMKPFTAAQRGYLRSVDKNSMVPLPGAGGALRIDSPAGVPFAVWKPAARQGTAGLNKDGQMIAEVIHSRLGRILGLRVPHAEALALDGEAGVLVRWIPGTTDLERLSQGARAALKDQVAQYRPLQIVMGNYDVHFGNYKVDRAGNVWALDAGMAYLTTPSIPVQDVAARFGARTFLARGQESDAINWTRWLRDWYRELGDDARNPAQVAVRRMEELLSPREMAPTARDLEALPAPQLRAIVEEAVSAAGDDRGAAPAILETLETRRSALDRLVNERWRGALSADD